MKLFARLVLLLNGLVALSAAIEVRSESTSARDDAKVSHTHSLPFSRHRLN